MVIKQRGEKLKGVAESYFSMQKFQLQTGISPTVLIQNGLSISHTKA